jgi:hypothetical protein
VPNENLYISDNRSRFNPGASQVPCQVSRSLAVKMSDGVLTILDGSQLRSPVLSLPGDDAALTFGEVLDLADSIASSALFGISLPDTLRRSALRLIHVDDVGSFSSTQLGRGQVSQYLSDYLAAIADQLKGTSTALHVYILR